MVYIFEGLDNCLKDTLILKLRGVLSPETQVLKFSNPPKVSNKEEYQRRHFKDMFDLIALSISANTRNIILNRAHLGEYVYSPVYRNYQAEWIFDLEEEFLKTSPIHISATKLILLYDSDNNQLRKREDGKSLSETKDEKLNDERKRFLEAFNKSRFHNKAEFDLSNFLLKDETDPTKEIDAEQIFQKIFNL